MQYLNISSSFTPGSILTSSQMQQLRDNWLATCSGYVGASVFAEDAVGEKPYWTLIQSLNVTSATLPLSAGANPDFRTVFHVRTLYDRMHIEVEHPVSAEGDWLGHWITQVNCGYVAAPTYVPSLHRYHAMFLTTDNFSHTAVTSLFNTVDSLSYFRLYSTHVDTTLYANFGDVMLKSSNRYSIDVMDAVNSGYPPMISYTWPRFATRGIEASSVTVEQAKYMGGFKKMLHYGLPNFSAPFGYFYGFRIEVYSGTTIRAYGSKYIHGS